MIVLKGKLESMPARVFGAIAIFIILVTLYQFVLWAVIWFGASNSLDDMMDYLVSRVTETNCLDDRTGEYDAFLEKLIRYNDTNYYHKYLYTLEEIEKKVVGEGINEHFEYEFRNDVRINDSNDGFKVTTYFNLDGVTERPLYSYATAQQKYQPIYVELESVVMLPMPFYLGRTQDLDDSMRAGLGDATLDGGGMVFARIPKTNTPCLLVKLVRKRIITGTKYYKGLPLFGG